MPEKAEVTAYTYQNSGELTMTVNFFSKGDSAIYLDRLLSVPFVHEAQLISIAVDEETFRYDSTYELKLDTLVGVDQMTKWLEQNKNIVLIIVLILFVILALFFMFLIRPLAADEETKRQELNRINDDVSFYQNHLNELTPQTFTDQEKDLLIGKVPATPNVEEVVKDLEKTEIKTGAVIDNVAISIFQNEAISRKILTFKLIAEGQENQETNAETVNSKMPTAGHMFYQKKLSSY